MEANKQYHSHWKNIFDKDRLKGSVNVIALFITVYELLEDRIVTYPKDFYTIIEFDEEAKRNYEKHLKRLFNYIIFEGEN